MEGFLKKSLEVRYRNEKRKKSLKTLILFPTCLNYSKLMQEEGKGKKSNDLLETNKK